STRPGVIYSPATFTVFAALAAGISAATAAIRPSFMATSRRALILFFGSMTWPPFSRRSYSWPYTKPALSSRRMIRIGRYYLTKERRVQSRLGFNCGILFLFWKIGG